MSHRFAAPCALSLVAVALALLVPNAAHAVPPERVVFAGGLEFGGLPGGNHGLWTVNVDGTGLRFLTVLGDSEPALSSRGQELLYWGSAPGTPDAGVDVTDVDARTWQRVAGGEARAPHYYPSSSRIVYQVWDEGPGHMPQEQYDIFSANVDGTYVTENVDWYGRQEHPAVSPDGSMLAFESDSPPNASPPWGWPYNAIYVGELHTAEQTLANAHRLNDFSAVEEAYSPTFSPDGQRVAFTGRRPGEDEFHIWEANIDGTGLHQVTATPGAYEWSPQFLADGRLVYGSDREVGGTWQTSLYVANANGTNEQTILSGFEWIDSRFSTRQLSAGVSYEDFVAAEFRPQLFFDDDDLFRPLNVDAFLGEANLDGTARHLVCDDDGVGLSCSWLTDPLSLRAHYEEDSFIDIAGTGDESNYFSPECHTAELRDCDSGYRTSSYYHLASTASYDYLEYWHFYRYDDAPDIIGGLDTHEGDWEGVTVAVSPVLGSTFDFALYAQHGHYNAYLRGNTECDNGGAGSCGTQSAKTGRRVRVYVGNGNHAANPTPGAGRNGEDAWLANDGESRTSLRRFPARLSWTSGEGYWTNWPGRWGAVDDPQDGQGPLSPGNQFSLFDPPFDVDCVDGVCPSAARGRRMSGISSGCDRWFGHGVVATACAEEALARALRAGTLHRPGTTRLQVSGRRQRSASAPGVVQLMGQPLRVGDRLLVSGSGSPGATLTLRIRSAHRTYTARFDHMEVGSSRSGVVAIRGGTKPRVSLHANGRVLPATSVRELPNPPSVRKSAGRQKQTVGLRTVASGSGKLVLRFSRRNEARLVRLLTSTGGRVSKHLRVAPGVSRVELPLGSARFIAVELAGRPESRLTFPAPVRVKPTPHDHGVVPGPWSQTAREGARRIRNPRLVSGADASKSHERVSAGRGRAPGTYRLRRVR